MMLTGRIWKDSNAAHGWGAECAAFRTVTQGNSRADACAMLAESIELLCGNDVKLTATEIGPHRDDGFAVSVVADNPALLIAGMLKFWRERNGLTSREVAEKLGSGNVNSYAAYEQGKREPSLGKLVEILAVVAPEMALVVEPRNAAVPEMPPKKRKAS